MTPATKKKIERMADRIEAYHGCFSGDCPHEKQVDCYKEMIKEGATPWAEWCEKLAAHPCTCDSEPEIGVFGRSCYYHKTLKKYQAWLEGSNE